MFQPASMVNNPSDIIADQFGRPMGSLRISVTDRCNIRCGYCMPEEDYVWLPRQSLLTFEELTRLTDVFASVGVTKVRITGGEPLLRQDLPDLVGKLRSSGRFSDIALTTNGILLAKFAASLHAAGLGRVTVSLDTLRPERFTRFTRSKRHADVIAGIEAVQEAGFQRTKLNTVVIRRFNDDELIDLIEFCRTRSLEPRFIEYMDVGGATRWSMDMVVSRSEILEKLRAHYGDVTPVAQDSAAGVAPAESFVLPNGTRLGIIASTTQPFCKTCDRSRLTADGMWFLCLYATDGVDLKEMLRGGASDEELAAAIRSTWSDRSDRGAEQRLQVGGREALYQVESLRSDPHREMHTRGG